MYARTLYFALPQGFRLDILCAIFSLALAVLAVGSKSSSSSSSSSSNNNTDR